MDYTLFSGKSDSELRQLRLALKPLRKQYKLVFSSLNLDELQSNIEQYWNMRHLWDLKYQPTVSGFLPPIEQNLSSIPLIDCAALYEIIEPADQTIQKLTETLTEDLQQFSEQSYGRLVFSSNSGMTWSYINTILDSIKL